MLYKLIRRAELRQDVAAVRIAAPNASSSRALDNVFMVPYTKNEHFTGRSALLVKLHDKLRECVPKQYNHRVALHGLGGVGKTQVALEYVYTHKTSYDSIYWISGVNRSALLSGFQNIARKTQCINGVSDLEPSDVAKAVLSWLNRQDRWLLVIDNLEDAAIVDHLLPERTPQKHTLITMRNPNTDEVQAEGLEVGPLDHKDAVELLLLRSKLGPTSDESVSEAEEVVKELGCLALAIEQAAAYIREASKDLFKFLPSYRKNRKTHHSRIPKGNWQYEKSVATTWHLSFHQVEKNNLAAKKLLQLFAFMNPDGILTAFLDAGKEGLDADLRDIVDDSDCFNEAMSELERFSFIRREFHNDRQRITVHRLVQLVVMDSLQELERNKMIHQVHQLGIAAFPEPPSLKSCVSMLNLCREYRSQIMCCLQHEDFCDGNSKWHVLAGRVVDYLYADGYYKDCLELSMLTSRERTRLLGAEHLHTIESKCTQASTYRMLGRFDEALALFQETLNISRRVLGPEHDETLLIMDGLAGVYADMAEYTNACHLYEETVRIRTRILGVEHPQTLPSVDGLAHVYRKLGRYNVACALHLRTLRISKEVLGPEHVDTLSSMVRFGWIQWRMGQYVEALQLFQESFNIRTRVLGPEHPHTLMSMDSVAWGYWRLGQERKANISESS
jgi:tetratricopeptide (TPR) repeat protein